MFLSKYIVYKSRQMNKYSNMCMFSSKLMHCSKHCHKSQENLWIMHLEIQLLGFLVRVGRMDDFKME